jgi:hypothetical protein
MADWRPAYAITELRNEVNAKHPNRDTASDGIIGDTAHQAEKSDHNPNSHNVVQAWDITTDTFTDAMAEWLKTTNDPRVKYVIYKHRIWSTARSGEGWRTYTGSDPHTSHIHLSVSDDPGQYDRTDSWHFEANAAHVYPHMTDQEIYASLAKHYNHPVSRAWIEGALKHPYSNAWGNGIVHNPPPLK